MYVFILTFHSKMNTSSANVIFWARNIQLYRHISEVITMQTVNGEFYYMSRKNLFEVKPLHITTNNLFVFSVRALCRNKSRDAEVYTGFR